MERFDLNFVFLWIMRRRLNIFAVIWIDFTNCQFVEMGRPGLDQIKSVLFYDLATSIDFSCSNLKVLKKNSEIIVIENSRKLTVASKLRVTSITITLNNVFLIMTL